MGRPAQANQAWQLPLQDGWTERPVAAHDASQRTPGHVHTTPRPARTPVRRARAPLCAACQAREARYGFQDHEHPTLDRPRTLCFECFRLEIDRRQAEEAAQLARGREVAQPRLPLDQTLDALALRRRRAQIAARRAVGE